MKIKERLSHIGFAVLYLLVFIVPQFFVTSVVTLFISFKHSFDAGLNGAGYEDVERLTAEATEKALDFINRNTMDILMISSLLTLLIVVIIIKARGKSAFDECGVRKIEAGKLIAPLLLGISLQFVVTVILVLLVPEDMLLEYQKASSSALMIGDNPIKYFLQLAVITPIVEEIVFRGLVFSRLEKAMPTWVALIISSVVFGVLHGQAIWAIYAAVLGAVLCLIYIKYRSVAASIAVHAGLNGIGAVVSIFEDKLPDAAGMVFILASIPLFIVSTVIICRTKTHSENNQIEN